MTNTDNMSKRFLVIIFSYFLVFGAEENIDIRFFALSKIVIWISKAEFIDG